MSMELSERTIRKLDFIDRCRERFSETDINKLKLPQIIAVGDQSSGKSSILEAISGIKLPKGTDTVTKRPIVCRMRRSDIKRCSIRCDAKEYNDVEDVEKKIREVQGSNVVKAPIYVDVCSADVPPLTIIDLPGIVRQATRGQSESIVKDTKQVAMEYMRQENSLILCVILSNIDFNTIDTLNLVSECDKDKSRTIGVLTKIDKLGSTEIHGASEILKNITKPLKQGYYGLILSDAVLQLNNSEREDREKEEFDKFDELRNGCSGNLGLKNFTKKLVNELVILIDGNLPTLKGIMVDLLKSTENDLEKMSDMSLASKRKYLIEEKDGVLLVIDNGLVKGVSKLHLYPKCIKYLVDNKVLDKVPKEKHDTFHYVQRQIYLSLSNKLTRLYKDNFKLPNAKYSAKYLQDLADRCSTEHIQIFISPEPFKEVVRLHLDEYLKLGLECLETCNIFAKLFIEDWIESKPVDRYPGLRNSFKDICMKLIESQTEVTKENLSMFFESERSCFTQRNLASTKAEDKDAVAELKGASFTESSSVQNISKMVKSMPPSAVTRDKDADNISLSGKEDPKYYSGKKLKELLEEYIQNLIHRLADVIPNFIMLTLFEKLHVQLVSSLNDYVTGDEVLIHFALPDNDQQRINDLTKTKLDLQNSLKELKDLLDH